MVEYQQPVSQDSYGHFLVLAGQQLTGASSGTAAGTIVTGTIGSGTPTVANAIDMCGSFAITGTAAAGALAIVYFLNPLPGPPKSVLVNCILAAATTSTPGIAAAGLVNTGLTQLTIYAATLTAASYTVSYQIIC